jgi:hypothetical protein
MPNHWRADESNELIAGLVYHHMTPTGMIGAERGCFAEPAMVDADNAGDYGAVSIRTVWLPDGDDACTCLRYTVVTTVSGSRLYVYTRSLGSMAGRKTVFLFIDR